jgi:peptidoglycan/xylan/chitin deacetylase (PgdA/CDA1 family)
MMCNAHKRDEAVRPLRRKLSRAFSHVVATKRVRVLGEAPLVSFTFDDVPDSAYTNGAVILESHGVRGTFYVAGGLCGSVEADRRLMSACQYVDLHRRGHEIGCHTFSHPAIDTLNGPEFATELERNKAFFSALIPGATLENFAYPFGVSSLARKLDAQRKFCSCRGVRAGINIGAVDLGMLKAVLIGRATAFASIAHSIDEAVSRNGWLILFTHDVTATPTAFGCMPSLLDAAVGYAIARRCAIVTVREALRRSSI